MRRILLASALLFSAATYAAPVDPHNIQVDPTTGALTERNHTTPAPGGPPPSGTTTTGTPPSTTPPATVPTYTAQPSALPNVLFQLDAAMPSGTATAVSGTPYIQVDASNNVLAASLPDGSVLTHGFGEALLVPNGWAPGTPVFRDTGAQPGAGFEAFNVPLTAAKRTIQPGQSSDRWFVIRQLGNGGELFRTLAGDKGVKMFGGGGSDCAYRIEANFGSAIGNEPGSAATACGQRQIIEVISNDSNGTLSIFRNGARTYTTPGGGVSGIIPDLAQLFNQCNCEIAFHEMTLGIGAIADRQKELDRLVAKYSVDGPVAAITEGPVVTPPVAVDLQGDFLTTVNIPKAGGNGVPLPTNSNITLPAGLAFEPGAQQVFGAIFGTAVPNANITTTQQVYDTFYTTTMEGNLNAAIGSPMDTGQGGNNVFYTVLRTYPPSSPNNLHVVGSDGLHLRAACSANHTKCGPGQIYGAGTILSQVAIRPGMTIKLRRKVPKGDHSWAPAWLFSINAGIPPTGTTDLFSAAAQAVNHNCGQASVTGDGHCQEVDIDDAFSRFGAGTATGHQINHGYPDIYGSRWQRGKFPHLTYAANGNSYVTHLGAGPDYEEVPVDQSAAMNDLTFDWRPDGTMNVFLGARRILSGYQDFTTSVVYNDNGTQRYVGMQLMLMNQAVPGFSPGAATVTENDGLGVDGWAPVYEQVAIWNGNVANPTANDASPVNAYAGNTGDPYIGPATWTISNTRVIADTAQTLATHVSYANANSSGPESSSLLLIGLSTSNTTPPSCKGGITVSGTCYGVTDYYNNGSGDWINFRKGPGVIPALPSGTYYFWVQTPDGVDHLADPTPYVKP